MWKLINNVFRCTASRHLNITRENPARIVTINDFALKKSSWTSAAPVGVAKPSSRQPGSDGLLRNGGKYLQPSLPSKMQVITCAKKAGDTQQLSDDNTQPFLYRKSKLLMLHRRNSKLDPKGSLEIPFLDPKTNLDNRTKLNKKFLMTQDAKVMEKLPAELLPVMEGRSYAQMIADYSESMEKEKLKQLAKQSPKGLLSSLSTMTKRQAQESNSAMTEKKNRKSSPNVRNNAQKRDYVTKHLKSLRVEETWGSRFLNNSPKTDFENEFNLDYKAIAHIEKEKENITARWVQAIQPKKKSLLLNAGVQDCATKTGDEKISDKTQEDVGEQAKVSDCQMMNYRSSSTSTCKRPTCNEPEKKKKGELSTLRGLPWWASCECTAKSGTKMLKATECLNEVYPKDQNIQVLATEDISICNNKVIKVVNLAEPQLATSVGQRLRKRKKTSSISKVTKHIEEKLQEKKKEMEEKKPSIKQNQTEEAEKTTDVKEDGCKKNDDPPKGNKSNAGGDQSLKSNAKKLSYIALCSQPNVFLETDLDDSSSKETKLNVDAEKEALLAKSEKSSKDEVSNSRRKGKGTEYRSKRIPDVLKPIEKRDDGTLIDYGLKVPTRKPRLKRPSEKSTNLPGDKDNSPKKTISAPHSELPVSKTGLPVKIGTNLPQKNLSDTISELNKSTIAFSKPTTIEEATNECLEQVQNSILPEKFRSILPKMTTLSNFVSESLTNSGDNTLKLSSNAGDNEYKPEMLEIRNKIRQRLGLPLITYDPIKGYIIIPHPDSKVSLDSHQSEKELIYSAWLNRFHTRKHDVFIK